MQTPNVDPRGPRGRIRYEHEGEHQEATWAVDDEIITVRCPQGEKRAPVGGLRGEAAAYLVLGEIRHEHATRPT